MWFTAVLSVPSFFVSAVSDCRSLYVAIVVEMEAAQNENHFCCYIVVKVSDEHGLCLLRLWLTELTGKNVVCWYTYYQWMQLVVSFSRHHFSPWLSWYWLTYDQLTILGKIGSGGCVILPLLLMESIDDRSSLLLGSTGNGCGLSCWFWNPTFHVN